MKKKLPYSFESEMAILGSLLMFPGSIQIIQEFKINSEDFFILEHKIIFEHMMSLVHQNSILDTTTLVNRLKDYRILNKIGGFSYLLKLSQSASTLVSLRNYIKIVLEKAQLRRLIEIGKKIMEKGFDSTIKLNKFLSDTEKEIFNIAQTRYLSLIKKSSDVVDEFLKNLKKIQNKGDKITGLKTGFNNLNNITNGLQNGDLIIIAARPSMGKTSFALNLAFNISKLNFNNKASVALFSLEMPSLHLISRILASQSSVKSEFLRNGKLNSEMMDNLFIAAKELSNLDFYIDDSSIITMPEIFTKCRKLKFDNKLNLIVIDYIQLISGSGRFENRQQEVSDISRNLKQLAREMDVPVIAISQLSRSVEKRDIKIPQLSDLRESGSLEQDADIVMFLYRDSYYSNTYNENKNYKVSENINEQVLIKISKHRNGALASFNLSFDPTIGRFYEIVQNF